MGRARLGGALVCALGLALCAVEPSRAGAQEWSGNEGSTTSGPSLDQYLKEAGPDAKVVDHGALKIDGKAVNCGKRPTVMTSNFDSWGGAFTRRDLSAARPCANIINSSWEARRSRAPARHPPCRRPRRSAPLNRRISVA